MPGFGFELFGFSSFGGISHPVEPAVQQLADFEFLVEAKSEGYSNRIKYRAPLRVDYPLWSGRLRILRKRGEWPLAWDDPGAFVTRDITYVTGGISEAVIETDLDADETYYYALFALGTDGLWIHDRFTDRGSAYPYARWGFTTEIYDALPRGFRSEDLEEHLYHFLLVVGAIFDDLKTDIEHLLTLFQISAVHDDLIWMLDRHIGWPTWHATHGLQRRKETAEASELYRLLGRAVSYEQILSEISDWSVEVIEGWRYVMMSNDLACTTPDFNDADLLAGFGRVDDRLKYTSSEETGDWHSMHGLLFVMSEVESVSGPLTNAMVTRSGEMIEWARASYVTYALLVSPLSNEAHSLARVLDDWEQTAWYSESELVAVETDLGYTTNDIALFLSNTASSTSTTVGDRTFHNDFEYI